ncbi:MAG TPA: Hsp70 family protein [Spirochaetia bacterium]|nr:Hsp70 family protein [Spirochaetia bacterium]
MIGIRLANNSFFPVLDEAPGTGLSRRTQKKRLILTTVKDNQPTVQIDLYRGSEKDISRDSYVASLTVQNISPMRAGEPDIELVMGKDAQGQLEAHAYDRAGGAENSLAVRLEELEDVPTDHTPDFSIGDDFSTPDTLGEYDWDAPVNDEQESEPAQAVAEETRSTPRRDYRMPEPAPKRRTPILALVLLAIGVIAIVLLGYFLLRSKPSSAAPALVTPPTIKSAPAQTGKAAATVDAPAPVATGAAAAVPAATAQGGVWYRVAFGDTLWDLAYSFYNNPRQFPRIAQENKIPDPNKIYGGRRIFIPLTGK